MTAPYVYIEAFTRIDLVLPGGRVETFRASGGWSSFGVAWACAAPLAGPGDPVLFWSDVARGNLARGYTLRRDDARGLPVFVPVSLSTGM